MWLMLHKVSLLTRSAKIPWPTGIIQSRLLHACRKSMRSIVMMPDHALEPEPAIPAGVPCVSCSPIKQCLRELRSRKGKEKRRGKRCR
jgi:hypothetical protein